MSLIKISKLKYSVHKSLHNRLDDLGEKIRVPSPSDRFTRTRFNLRYAFNNWAYARMCNYFYLFGGILQSKQE